MGFLSRFLVSKVSGYLFILLAIASIGIGAVVVDKVRDYKQLQVDAAYCKGQLEAQDVIASLQERAIEGVEGDASDVIDEVETLKKESYDDTIDEPTGCAAERAPDAILRYHGWMRGEQD